MSTPEVELIRYVFLDVVGFTHRRSVEAQAEIVDVLNSIVRESVSTIECDEIIHIPTGDGMAICIVGRSPYDSHILVALAVLSRIRIHNESIKDKMRQFEVRIGVNENSDNILVDINAARNIAGAGINLAARIMDLADAGQVIVSTGVHDVLSIREKYMESFRRYEAHVKHGRAITVFQLISDDEPGLNTDSPSALTPQQETRRRLSEYEAYFLGFGLRHRKSLLRVDEHVQGTYAATVLLYFMANDAVGIAHQTEANLYRPHVFGGGKLTFKEAFDYYMSVDFWVISEYAKYVASSLSHLSELFEDIGGIRSSCLPKKAALEVISKEQPAVLTVLELEGESE